MNKNELVIFETSDGSVVLDVALDSETVWLNRNQIALLFERDVKTIGKHIKNALKEELLDNSVVANFATTANDGKNIWQNITTQMLSFQLDIALSQNVVLNLENGRIAI